MVSEVLEVSDSNFEDEIIKSDLPTMVDFWAQWCQPCLITGPWIEELAREYDGRFKTAKMNVAENAMTPNRYAIRSIPKYSFLRMGNWQIPLWGL